MQAILARSENLKTEMQDYLKTAGDEVEEASPVKAAAAGIKPPLRDADAARKAHACIATLGGKPNIIRGDACAETRLRLVVRNEAQIREAALSADDVAEIVRLHQGETIHLLAGFNADQCAAEMRRQLAA